MRSGFRTAGVGTRGPYGPGPEVAAKLTGVQRNPPGLIFHSRALPDGQRKGAVPALGGVS